MYTHTLAAALVLVLLGIATPVNAHPFYQGTATNTATSADSSPNPRQRLTMERAVQIALSAQDPYLNEPIEIAASYEAAATADAQLSDPKIRATFFNFPLNSFSYTQEPLTQLQLGVSQSFPRGNTLKFRKQRKLAQAQGQRYLQSLRSREIILDTRTNWLDLLYWNQAILKVEESRAAVAQLIGVIEASYATGRNTSQDVLRAELELSLLDDRLIDIARSAAVTRARLERTIGTAVQQPMHRTLPVMKYPSDLRASLELLAHHPAAQIKAAQIQARDKDVNIAQEQYKPGWTVNLGFGARGGDRADFASLGVVMDVPLFAAKRQDKRLSAAKRMRQASRLSRDTTLLDLKKNLSATFADWQRLGQRIALYQSAVTKRARETSEASLTSYQAGVVDFSELVRARLAELDVELKLLKLQTMRLTAQAQLLFLEGEDDA